MSLVYRSFLFQKTGYSLAAHMDVLAMAEAGAGEWPGGFKTCTLTPKAPPLTFDLFGRAQQVAQERHDPASWKLPGVQIIRSIPTDVFAPYERARSDQGFPIYRGPEQRVICATVFEAPRWPMGWASSCNLYDAIVVPGEWLAQAARAAGVESRIEVIPHAMEWPPERDENGLSEIPPVDKAKWWWERPSQLRDGYGYRGPHVFTDGTNMLRKNLSSAVEAFWRAFDHDDGAVMLLKTSWFKPIHEAVFMHELSQIRKKLGRTKYAPVGLIDSTLTWSEHWSLFHWCTTYLSMAYAEGVGYPLLQAGGLGKVIVCTDSPGHRDTAPQALFVESRDATFGQLRPFDPVSTLDRCEHCGYEFGVAHIHEDDPWRVPLIESAAVRLREATKPQVQAGALIDAVKVHDRHNLRAVGEQFLKLAREAAP